ncbi:ribonuclease 3-like protein 2-like isoform X1 [Carex littledalei]|uniref:Ribonuclease 3-like protein 2-like isoform X1 n=1 Tax=Carex littledalei TaxID=544730 RepID=A0A833VMV4_9POAL|nr:ribonuclease 3-like protein 2-like isoform X1 [Carex littledalei]
MNPPQIANGHTKQLHDQLPPHRTAVISNSDPASCVREAERILGYSFLKPKLLEQALTHSSFSNGTTSYERLEFVGDAALNLAMTNYLYLSHPDLGPGHISTLRSANVSTEKLARVAVRHGIYPLVLRNSPKLDKQVEEFTKAVVQEPEEDQIYGGSTKKAPKVLADVVESIAAAIYEDSSFNLDVMWKIVRRLLEPLITADTFGEQPVTTLYELCQKSGKDVKFHIWQKGKTTTVNVFVDSELVGYGSSKQKTIARLNAARDALEKLNGEKSNLLIKSQRKEVGDEEEAKQKLNEFCMKRHWPPPVYKLEEEKGPAHSRTFICSVHVETTNDTFIALSECRSRVKDAEKSAALKMLSIVVKEVICVV